MKLKGKTVWITGASRGIGLALALECQKRGAQVVLCVRDVSEEVIAPLKAQFPRPQDVFVRHLDVADRSSIDHFCDQAIQDTLAMDVFINNAGLLTGGLLEHQPIDAIYAMYQVNLVGPTHLLNRLIPHLEKRPEALIVNNSSVSGVLYLPCASSYAASKAGIVSLSRCLESEFRGSGLRCLTLITPGVKTRMYDEIPKLYGDHLDLSALSSRPAEVYAAEVANAMESGATEYRPGGVVRLALGLSQLSVRLFRWLSTLRFRRHPIA
jgi:uncharacterized protein